MDIFLRASSRMFPDQNSPSPRRCTAIVPLQWFLWQQIAFKKSSISLIFPEKLILRCCSTCEEELEHFFPWASIALGACFRLATAEVPNATVFK